MRHVRTSGSFHQVGYEVGRACRADIPEVYERTIAFLLEHTSVGTEARIHSVAEEYLTRADIVWSPSVDFLGGLARGADVSMSQIALICFAEEASSEFLPASPELQRSKPTPTEKCSTLVMRRVDGSHLIVHNEDYWPQFFGKMVLLDAQFEGYPRLVCLTYPGWLPGLAGSLNASGVAITNNGLWPKAQPGVPKQVVHFMASLARDMSEAESFLTTRPISVTTHYVVAYGQTREVISLAVANLAVSSVEMDVRTITDPFFCHTNHVLDGYLELKEPDPAIANSPHSFVRYEKLKGLAPLGKLLQAPQDALEFFSINDGVLHRTPEQNPTSVTLATVVICPESREFWVRDAHPAAAERDWYFRL